MFDARARIADSRRVLQRGPLARGERNDHHTPAVARLEIVAERAIQVVAVLLLIAATEFRLRDTAEIPDHRKGHVRERKIHQLPLAGQAAMAFSGQQSDGRKRTERDVPRGQDAVERLGEIARPGRPRKAGRRVDGVIDLAGTVGIAGERDHHQVGAALAQRVVFEPAAGGKIRQKDAALFARRGDQRRHQLATLGRAHVDLNRALALVQAGPEKTLAVGRQRPSMVVEAAANLVEADNVGAELRERHPAERRCHERGAFDHAEAREDSAHAITPTRRQSSTSCEACEPPSRSARTRERRCTNPPPLANGSVRSSSSVLRNVSLIASVPGDNRDQVRQRARRLRRRQAYRVTAVN